MLNKSRYIIVMIFLTLMGCTFFNGDRSFFYNRDRDYLTGYSIAPICIPPGLSSSKIEARYPVADRNYPSRFQRIDLTPPELYTPCVNPQPIQQPMIAPAPTRPCAVSQMSLTKHNQYVDGYTRSASGKGMYIPDLLPKKMAQPVSKPATMQPQQLAQNEEPKKKMPNVYYDRYTRR